jgi:WD40 repeat protein
MPAGPWNTVCPACLARLSFGLTQGPDPPYDEEGEEAVGTSSHSGVPASMRFGNYELLEEIGRGGMGIVYRARQTTLGRIVAVKMVPFGPLATEESLRRFRFEAEAAAQLRHPNITAIHEVGEQDGHHYFSMDYVEGGTLADALEPGPWPARKAAALLQTIAEAVHYAHEHQILHRDLKPSNILIDDQGRPHITDFGLARRLSEDSTLTLTGAVLGSPNYMPPEQASPERIEPSPRSDVYSLGAILYRMVTGQPPFQAESVEALLRRLLTEDPVAPRLLNPGLPADLETICLRCLAKEPARRYATAREVAEELGRFLRHEPIHARPTGPAEKVWRWARRRPALAATLALLLLVFLAGASGVLWQWRRAEGAAADTRHHLYAADTELAYQRFAAGDIGRARRLLEAHRPEPGSGQEDLRGWEWRYLWERCRGEEERTLARHRGAVPALDCSPDGRWVASGDLYGELRILDRTNDREVLVTNLNAGRINALAFSPDGKLLAGTTARSEVRFWRTASWIPGGVLRHPGVSHLAFSPDSQTLATANGEEDIRLWKVQTGEAWKRIPSGRGWKRPRLLAFAPDGRTLAIGDATGALVFWDWQADVELSGARAHRPVADGSEALSALSWSPAGTVVATGGGDRTVRLRAPGSKTYRVLSNHTEAVTCLAFAPDGRSIVTGGLDQSLRLWDLTSYRDAAYREIASWHAHAGGCLQVRFDPAGSKIFSSGVDGAVKLWNLHPARREDPSRELPTGVWEVLIFADPPVLALGTSGQQWQTWNLRDGFAPLASGQHQPFTSGYVSLKSVGEGVILEMDGQARAIQMRRLTNDIPEPFATIEQDHLVSLDLSRDGRLLAGSGVDRVYAWDVKTKTLLRSWPTPGVGVSRHARASPDGQCVVTLQKFDGTVEFFDVATGERKSLPGHLLDAATLGFSPDGRWLATAGLGSAVRVYDVKSRRQTAVLESNHGPVSAVGFSKDGLRLACGTSKGALVVYDLPIRREVALLAGHEKKIYSVAFLDENTLASASLDRVALWQGR